MSRTVARYCRLGRKGSQGLLVIRSSTSSRPPAVWVEAPTAGVYSSIELARRAPFKPKRPMLPLGQVTWSSEVGIRGVRFTDRVEPKAGAPGWRADELAVHHLQTAGIARIGPLATVKVAIDCRER